MFFTLLNIYAYIVVFLVVGGIIMTSSLLIFELISRIGFLIGHMFKYLIKNVYKFLIVVYRGADKL